MGRQSPARPKSSGLPLNHPGVQHMLAGCMPPVHRPREQDQASALPDAAIAEFTRAACTTGDKQAEHLATARGLVDAHTRRMAHQLAPVLRELVRASQEPEQPPRAPAAPAPAQRETHDKAIGPGPGMRCLKCEKTVKQYVTMAAAVNSKQDELEELQERLKDKERAIDPSPRFVLGEGCNEPCSECQELRLRLDKLDEDLAKHRTNKKQYRLEVKAKITDLVEDKARLQDKVDELDEKVEDLEEQLADAKRRLVRAQKEPQASRTAKRARHQHLGVNDAPSSSTSSSSGSLASGPSMPDATDKSRRIGSHRRAQNWTDDEDAILIGAVARHGPDFGRISRDSHVRDCLHKDRHKTAALRVRFNLLTRRKDPDAFDALESGIQARAQACRTTRTFMPRNFPAYIKMLWPQQEADFDDVVKPKS